MLNRLLCLLLCITLLSACDHIDQDNPIRAIQYMEVSDSSSGQTRRISGIVQSSQKADLSFELGGNVLTVPVTLGARVVAGQVLATLDPKPYQLTVNAAQADLTKAKALLLDKESDYKAKAKLYEKRFVSKTVVDTAKADHEAALQNVESMKAKLQLAEHDLAHTELKAPFDGEIAKRSIEPATNVSMGQTVFQLLGQGGFEIEVSVPESLRRMIRVNMPVVAMFPTLNGVKSTGHISEISASANELNAFPTKIMIEPADGIYPGLTAEVIFNDQQKSDALVFLIPATALLPGPDDLSAYVYVYDPATSTVHKRQITAKHVQDNEVQVISGLALGDIIATAGVHFLYDGQKVTLYKEY